MNGNGETTRNQTKDTMSTKHLLTEIAADTKRCAEAQEKMTRLFAEFIAVVATRTEHRLAAEALTMVEESHTSPQNERANAAEVRSGLKPRKWADRSRPRRTAINGRG